MAEERSRAGGGADSGEEKLPLPLARLARAVPGQVRMAYRDQGVVARVADSPFGEALRQACEAEFSEEEWGALLETRMTLSSLEGQSASVSRLADHALLIFSLVRRARPESCLALGPAAGVMGAHAAQALALNRRGTLNVVGESEEGVQPARGALWLLRDHIRVYPRPGEGGSRGEVLKGVVRSLGPLDLVLADGAGALGDVSHLIGSLAPGAVVLCCGIGARDADDRTAWEGLRGRPEVAYSLELGDFGIVRRRADGDGEAAFHFAAAPDGTPDEVPEEESGPRPENLVWIFGSGRSGSTWLRSMMGELDGYRVWEEPMVGRLFGDFYARAQRGQLKSRNFIMGEPVRGAWVLAIRNFVLEVARGRFPGIGGDDIVVVKEPNGSGGAPLIMEALPESRLILLIRDPRDVVASVLDGARKGSWLYERKDDGRRWKSRALADNNPNAYARKRANVYMKHAGSAKRAYDAHRGPKTLVRYEELRADALGTMRRLYRELGLQVDDAELAKAVEKHAWENIPEEKKGEGKFFRKGAPGGWREDLTEQQARVVEKVAAPLLEEFYPTRGTS